MRIKKGEERHDKFKASKVFHPRKTPRYPDTLIPWYRDTLDEGRIVQYHDAIGQMLTALIFQLIINGRDDMQVLGTSTIHPYQETCRAEDVERLAS